MPDPQAQTFDPVAEFKTAWPAAANMDENAIRKNLQDPKLFRSAFPSYAHLDDATITSNMKQYAPGGAAQKTQAAARVAQPTEFEQRSAARGDSSTPWTDTAKGFGEGALKTAADVGWAINKIPYVGEKLVPSQGLGAENKIATPRTPGERLGSQMESVAEAAVPIGEVADAVKGSKYIKPIAQYATENVLPVVKSIPYIGRGIEAAEAAPTVVKAAVRGGATGATVGGVEQAIRTRDPYETAKGALYGGLTGAAAGAGAYGIRKLAGPAEEAAAAMPHVDQGPQLPVENRTPEGLPVIGEKPLTLSNPEVGRETAIQQPLGFPKVSDEAAAAAPIGETMPKIEPGRTGPPLQRLGDLIEAGAGTKPLEPNVSLRAQSVGAAAEGFKPIGDTMQNAGGKVTWRREPIVKTVGGLEEGPLRNVAPEKMPSVLGNEVERSFGGEPDSAAVEKQRLQTKYPDRETRQLVHANGEDIVDATGSDRDTLKAIHDLKNPDVRQAAMNAGENMVREDGSPIMVNNRMLSGDVSRQSMFKRLLDRGYTPKQIVEMGAPDAKPQAPAGSPRAAGKPGPIKSAPWTTEGEKTGD